MDHTIKELSRITLSKEKEDFTINQMELSILVIGLKTDLMEKEAKFILKKADMKDILGKGRNMDKENTHGQTVKFIRESLRVVTFTVREN